MLTNKLTLEEYIKIFNFLSKVIFYSTLGNPYSKNTNPLGPLRKECCTDLIKNDRYLNLAAEKLAKKTDIYEDFKIQDMYTSKISDDITVSIVTFENSKAMTETNSDVFIEEPLFRDDNIRLYVFIDTGLFDPNNNECISCRKYLNEILDSIHYVINVYPVTVGKNRGMKCNYAYFNELMSHLLYSNDDEEESYMHKINITIDKITGVVTDDSRDYLALNLDKLEEIRAIFRDFIYLAKY